MSMSIEDCQALLWEQSEELAIMELMAEEEQ